MTEHKTMQQHFYFTKKQSMLGCLSTSASLKQWSVCLKRGRVKSGDAPTPSLAIRQSVEMNERLEAVAIGPHVSVAAAIHPGHVGNA